MLVFVFGRINAPFSRFLSAITLFLLIGIIGWQQASPQLERIVPNGNRAPAGRLRKSVLTVRLETRTGRWYPDGEGGPSLVVYAFAEKGRALQNPGPLIRVPTGTTVRASVHNPLKDSVLIVYGLHKRPGSTADSIHVLPGATREVSFEVGAPGTYFYWGTTTHTPVDSRYGIDSQLHGAFIVDPPGTTRPRDRVFVLGSWTGPSNARGNSADLRVINGLSWPHTPHLNYRTGDTIRWRWVNPTDSPHPMHLHGFYYDITSRGTWAADTAFTANAPRVVTEMPLSGGTFTMRWVPDAAGNWLMHCHVAYHTSLWLSATLVPDPPDPILVDHMRGMRGMVLGITVRPGPAAIRRPEIMPGARAIRLVAQAAPKRFVGRLDEMAFVRQDGALPPARDSVPVPSSLLVLRRNEPVRITVVNRTRAETAVHWHGLEVSSYYDGVAGWSGLGARLAPVITPGDSFVAAFTPTRAGTFIYHAHSNENFQISLGLYGALLVVDSATYDPSRERLIILGSRGPGSLGARINGRLQPDTLRLKAGTAYRLRLIHMVADWTARIALLSGDSVVHWKALAKDGAELPASAQTVRPASLIAGPGETMDFEYTPSRPGLMRLDVAQRTGAWRTSLPIRVD